MSLLTAVHGRGLLSARPAAAAANEGYVYSASDADLYRSNGSTWDTIASAAVTDATITTTDVTTNNASTSKHGWLKKLSNVSTEFMNGTGAWSTPSASGLTHAYVGYNTIGGSSAAMTQYMHFTKIVTLASAGFLASIGVYCKSNSNGAVAAFRVGVWADVSTEPKQLLAGGGLGHATAGYFPEVTSGSASTAGWMQFPVGIYLTAGTYWIGFTQDAAGSYDVFYDGSGSDQTWVAGGDHLTAGTTRYAKTVTSNKYSIRASLLT